MARRQECPELYEVARIWADAALLDDDSLFTSGKEIWSRRWLDELHRRFVMGADEGRDDFLTKLERQFAGADPAVFQLMGELLFVHFLAAKNKPIGRKGKVAVIESVLGWSPEHVSIPATLDAALDQGVGHAGFGFNTYRWQQLRFLIEFSRLWKSPDSDEGRLLLEDPWEFKRFVESVPGGADGLQRNALLHLLHPDNYETAMALSHKDRIASAFVHLVSDPSDDVDRRLLQIREALTGDHGRGFSFYRDPLRQRWDHPKRSSPEPATPAKVQVPTPSPLPTEGPDEHEGVPTTLHGLADDLLIPKSHLDLIHRLLRHRRQVIFYGPPGTGKTYVARKLAAHIARDEERVDLVQFHPSYAYEDFVEGYRPASLKGNMAGFELREGPLKRIARRAEEASDEETFVLIIDEINRGNLGKVFGELYFLLEYRKEKIKLQYSDDAFSLPENLWIIGTMNTADRSIALVDSALRRRFHFSPFFPDQPPIEGLLARWLNKNKPELFWVAEVVDRANKKLGRRHAAIGPSYFMDQNLDEEWVELIWDHSVLPYIAEQFFGEDDLLKEFALDRLRPRATSTDEGGEQDDGNPEERDQADA